MQPTPQEQSLRPEQAAKLLGVKVRTVRRWLYERPDMPRPIKLAAGVTVFDRDELLAWRDAQPRLQIQVCP